jgi:transcriptional regulator CtsR
MGGQVKRIKPNPKKARDLKVERKLIEEMFAAGGPAEWELSLGEDFQCSPSSAADVIRKAFRAEFGYCVVTTTGSTVRVRIVPAPGPTHDRRQL